MSFLLRQLCITLVIVIAFSCSQGFSIRYGPESDESLQDRPWEDRADEEQRSQTRNFAAPRGKRLDETPQLRTGRSLPVDTESVPDEEDQFLKEADKRSPPSRIERAASGDKTFLRIGRAPAESTFLRIGRSPFLRVRKAPFLRIGRSPFLRIGRAPFLRIGRSSLTETSGQEIDRRSNDKTFLRIGRAPSDQTFLRIGRGTQSFLRIGRGNGVPTEDALETVTDNTDGDFPGEDIDTTGAIGKRGLRIGKRIIGAFSQGNSNDLTPEELQLLKENKDLLLEYMESHPEMFDGEQDENDDAYFAFPRQGRAMSFYFPRMGRAGDNDLSSPFGCEEGVRKVYKIGKGTEQEQELYSNEKPCCPGFVEQEKVYKDIFITECAVKSGSDKFRNYIGDE